MSNIITKSDITRTDLKGEEYIYIPQFTKGVIVNKYDNGKSSEVKFPNVELPVLVNNNNLIKIK